MLQTLAMPPAPGEDNTEMGENRSTTKARHKHPNGRTAGSSAISMAVTELFGKWDLDGKGTVSFEDLDMVFELQRAQGPP